MQSVVQEERVIAPALRHASQNSTRVQTIHVSLVLAMRHRILLAMSCASTQKCVESIGLAASRHVVWDSNPPPPAVTVLTERQWNWSSPL
jgi:hypothetical protein